MAKILYSPQALEDLQNIKSNILSEFRESVAQKVIKKIINSVSRLEEFPLSGVNLANNIDVPTDYYYLFTQKNYVFYRLHVNRVYVVRVLNQKQEYMQQLFTITAELE